MIMDNKQLTNNNNTIYSLENLQNLSKEELENIVLMLQKQNIQKNEELNKQSLISKIKQDIQASLDVITFTQKYIKTLIPLHFNENIRLSKQNLINNLKNKFGQKNEEIKDIISSFEKLLENRNEEKIKDFYLKIDNFKSTFEKKLLLQQSLFKQETKQTKEKFNKLSIQELKEIEEELNSITNQKEDIYQDIDFLLKISNDQKNSLYIKSLLEQDDLHQHFDYSGLYNKHSYEKSKQELNTEVVTRIPFDMLLLFYFEQGTEFITIETLNEFIENNNIKEIDTNKILSTQNNNLEDNIIFLIKEYLNINSLLKNNIKLTSNQETMYQQIKKKIFEYKQKQNYLFKIYEKEELGTINQSNIIKNLQNSYNSELNKTKQNTTQNERNMTISKKEKALDILNGNGPFFEIFVDISKLKFMNDNFSQEMGDLYLNSFANSLHKLLREELNISDEKIKLFKIGGDEFSFIVDYKIIDLYLDKKGTKTNTLNEILKSKEFEEKISANFRNSIFNDGKLKNELNMSKVAFLKEIKITFASSTIAENLLSNMGEKTEERLKETKATINKEKNELILKEAQKKGINLSPTEDYRNLVDNELVELYNFKLTNNQTIMKILQKEFTKQLQDSNTQFNFSNQQEILNKWNSFLENTLYFNQTPTNNKEKQQVINNLKLFFPETNTNAQNIIILKELLETIYSKETYSYNTDTKARKEEEQENLKQIIEEQIKSKIKNKQTIENITNGIMNKDANIEKEFLEEIGKVDKTQTIKKELFKLFEKEGRITIENIKFNLEYNSILNLVSILFPKDKISIYENEETKLIDNIKKKTYGKNN